MKLPLLIATLGIASAALADQPLTVAVLGFEGSDDKLRTVATESAELLALHLGTHADLSLVERAEIDRILGEQVIGLSGLTDPASAAKVGQLLGAKALITGRAIRTGDTTLLVAKMMSTETSRVFGETALVGKDLSTAASELAGKIAATLDSKRAAFEPVVVTRDQRVAKLRETVKGNGRTVLVKIEERDLGRPVIDPAAQTEFEKTLLELGFAIADPMAGVPAFRITGEAFSEPGARRGQLVSSRARVEVRVEIPDGKVLAVDRQTATAVDTAEAIAGKTALEAAAFDLVERLAPKMSD
ncbi:MAG: hypothetical protein Fur0032_22010 [Terrimicrobiaceae bacterium]